jgi:UDP-N-acetylglucosamine--N-acetylmuramyl-(pentapeptide) pyrophosphoryl-undecaprenol N-acetylglucosamine transferase
VLRERGHQLLFIGTQEGMEGRLVPVTGIPFETIRIGGLNRVGLKRQLQTTLQLPMSIAAAARMLRRTRAQAVFSTGGYVAGPVMIAAALAHVPLVLMEPNAVPGFANRKVARYVYRALVSFEETRRWFPAGRSEVTGLPVRAEFFSLPEKPEGVFRVLITGGSQGARTLNRAARESWPLFLEHAKDVCLMLQSGPREHATLAAEFAASGLCGEVTSFLPNIAEAFGQADVVVSRAGAGTISEIAASRAAAILVPLPFAADDHQLRNAERLAVAGAARLVLDREFTGERLFREVDDLRQSPETRRKMREHVRSFARPGAAERAAAVLEEAAAR